MSSKTKSHDSAAGETENKQAITIKLKNTMKTNLSLIAIAAGLAVTVSTSQATMNFAGINNAQFNASGNTFQLNPIAGSAAAPQFEFTGADAGLIGWISGGPWSVNMSALTTVSVGTITYQQAPLSGGGVLNIFDGSKTLTGNLSWGQIHSLSAGQGGVEDSLVINLADLAYSGANANLMALAAGKVGNLNLTFQFSGGSPNLSSIYNGGTGVTVGSYSGAVSGSTVVPEPATVVAGALLLLPFGVSALRIMRKRQQHKI